MKREYLNPIINVSMFEMENVITTSGVEGSGKSAADIMDDKIRSKAESASIHTFTWTL